MAGYKPKQFKLLHETKHYEYDTRLGGIDRKTGVFIPVESYSDLKKACKASDPYRTSGFAVFIDAITAAVETNQLDSTNWFLAFASIFDWKKFAKEIMEYDNPYRLSDRNVSALSYMFNGTKESKSWLELSYVETLYSLGHTLNHEIDWKRAKAEKATATINPIPAKVAKAAKK